MIELKKRYFLIIGIIALTIGLLIAKHNVNEQRREEDRMAVEQEQRELAETYLRLHYAVIRINFNDEFDFWGQGNDINGWWEEQFSIYQPLEAFGGHFNEHEISVTEYIVLRMYYHRTGVYLSHEKLVDYFSEEFEPDGSLRLYSNGNHPEIEAFVTWMWEGRRREEFREYDQRLNSIFFTYFSAHQDEGFRNVNFNHISPQMLDALARAEADPDYELDLTSLQEQGY